MSTLYLLVSLHGPVFLDGGVTEVADFLQHGGQEGGAKVTSVRVHLHSVLPGQQLATSNVVVEGGQCVQEVAAASHVSINTHTATSYANSLPVIRGWGRIMSVIFMEV